MNIHILDLEQLRFTTKLVVVTGFDLSKPIRMNWPVLLFLQVNSLMGTEHQSSNLECYILVLCSAASKGTTVLVGPQRP